MMTTETTEAAKAYAKNANEAFGLLETILGQLTDHAMRIPSGCRGANWAHVGDLGAVNELLRQVSDFLGK